MIEVEHLRKQYGSKTAVADLSLVVHPGEILGFLGPNGAGKSTTIKTLTGLVGADAGRAKVAGYDIALQPMEAKKRLGFVPESAKLFESLSADAFLDVVGSLYHLSPETNAIRRANLLGLFGLVDARYDRLATFSKGMRQKVVIAAALIHSPEVLILDEPFDGLDPNTIGLLKALLTEMAAQGKTIMFSSHIIDLVERVATRICIIHRGKKVAEGTAAEIRHGVGTSTLEQAFTHLTGGYDPHGAASEVILAMQADR